MKICFTHMSAACDPVYCFFVLMECAEYCDDLGQVRLGSPKTTKHGLTRHCQRALLYLPQPNMSTTFSKTFPPATLRIQQLSSFNQSEEGEELDIWRHGYKSCPNSMFGQFSWTGTNRHKTTQSPTTSRGAKPKGSCTSNTTSHNNHRRYQ